MEKEALYNMTTQQQAYIKGFVKRANEYGLNPHTILNLLKYAEAPPIPPGAIGPGAGALGSVATTANRIKNKQYGGATLSAADAAANAATLIPKLAPIAQKIVPGAGALTSGYSAINRYNNKDYAGTAIDTVGAIASGLSAIPPLAPITVPISAVATATNVARDTYRHFNSPAPQLPKFRTDPNDIERFRPTPQFRTTQPNIR